MSGHDNEDLIDYEDEHDIPTVPATTTTNGATTVTFRDVFLKPELLRAISDLGFEHLWEVQQECIPKAVLGTDVLCQAKAGHGKTVVFVLATLQQLQPVNGEVSVIVLCHARELAFQIKNEYTRFAKYMPDVRVATFYGGTSLSKDTDLIRDKTKCPHIVVATPSRLNALVKDKVLDAKNVKHFVLDECDKMIEQLDMRRDVQEIFRATPHHQQVMMFSTTLAKGTRATCKKFMFKPLEIFVDNETKLTLHGGLQQHYGKPEEAGKNRKLNEPRIQSEPTACTVPNSIADLATANAAWPWLKHEYEKATAARRITLRSCLYNIQHSVSQPVSVFIDEIQDIAHQLKDIGRPLGQDEDMDILLLRLHASFEPVRAAILAQITSCTFNDAVLRIREYETNHRISGAARQ